MFVCCCFLLFYINIAYLSTVHKKLNAPVHLYLIFWLHFVTVFVLFYSVHFFTINIYFFFFLFHIIAPLMSVNCKLWFVLRISSGFNFLLPLVCNPYQYRFGDDVHIFASLRYSNIHLQNLLFNLYIQWIWKSNAIVVRSTII